MAKKLRPKPSKGKIKRLSLKKVSASIFNEILKDLTTSFATYLATLSIHPTRWGASECPEVPPRRCRVLKGEKEPLVCNGKGAGKARHQGRVDHLIND